MATSTEADAADNSTGAAAVNCSWCGSADLARAWSGPEPRDFQVRACKSCGHHFTVPILGPDQIGAYYAEEYYGTRNKRFNPLMEAPVGWFRRRRAKRLGTFGPIGKVLDVGCGRGLTLNALRKLGWQTKGCEFSATSARYAREVLNLDVACEGFSPASYGDDEFDAVILWHVLEHLSNAREALETCARIVKPGGVLVIAVPNFESYQAQWTRYGWFHLDMPRHYQHYSASWLRERFDELGFDIRSEGHASGEQNPYGWIQSILNCWGLARNLLYDMLRNESARTVKHPWRQLPGQALASAVGLVVLLPFSLAMLAAESFGRRGATVEFYAVKRSAANSTQ
ncbi:MAG: class I SAM-dependent methyltransferase [Pirellulales bacterium]